MQYQTRGGCVDALNPRDRNGGRTVPRAPPAGAFRVSGGLSVRSPYSMSEPMTYRVYLRWPPQRVTDKTTTESRAVAEFAFKELLARADLAGKDVAATFTEKSENAATAENISYHDFRSVEPPENWGNR